MSNEIRTSLVMDLEGNVETKTGDVKKELDNVGKAADNTGRRFRSFFNNMTNGFRRVSGVVFSLKGAIAGIGIGALVRNSLNEADKIQKLTIKLGESAENISALRHVADGASIAFDTLTTSLQRQTRRISEVATTGSGVAVTALEELRLSANELHQLSPVDQFIAIAEAMSGIASQGDKVRLAMQIWDTEGVANLQAIEGGAQGVVSAMKEAAEQGFVLTQTQVEQAAQTNDAITKLINTVTGASQQVALALAPHIEQLAAFLSSAEGTAAIQGFAEGLKWIASHLDSIAQVVALLMGASMIPALVTTITVLGTLTAPIAVILGIAAAFVTFRDEIGAAWEAVRNFEVGIGPFKVSIGKMVDDVIGYVSAMVDGIKRELVDRFTFIVDAVGEKIDAVTGFFSDMWDQVVGHSYVPDMVDGIEDEFSRLPDVMVDPAEDATSAVSGFFEDLGRKIGNTIRDILSGTTSLKDGLKSLASDIGDMIQQRIVESATNGLMRMLPQGVQEFFGAGSGGNLGGYTNGGGIGGGMGQGSGGAGGSGSLTQIGSAIGKGILRAYGGGTISGAVGGIAGSVGGTAGANLVGQIYGAQSWAAANAAFSAGAPSSGIPGLTWGAEAGASAGSSAGASAGGSAASSGASGFGAWGGAAVMAAVAIGASMMEKSQQRMIKAAIKEMQDNFDPADMESIGLDSTWIGSLETAQEGVQSMWAAVDGKLVKALKEVDAISGGISLRFTESGELVHKLTGNVDEVRTALEGATITGYGLGDAMGIAMETAIEKGNGLEVSISGNAKHIKAALTEAADAGVGGFRILGSEGGHTTARITGDIGQWTKVLQGFVTGSVASAISGISAIRNEAGGATSEFLSMAAAARSAAAATSGLGGGGRSAQVSNFEGYAYGGVSRSPQLAWVSEGPYPVEAHIPMANGHDIPVRVSGAVPTPPAAVDLEPVVTELRAVRVDLDRVVGRPITRTIDRSRRRAAATVRRS